jgi:hypothetical protein
VFKSWVHTLVEIPSGSMSTARELRLRFSVIC